MAIRIGEQDTGSVVYQVTEESLSKSNIYCEVPYCSADSKVFVYERQNPEYGPNSTEYVICEFGTWETQVGGRGLGPPAITHKGMLYYRRQVSAVAQELVRLDLGTGESEVIFGFPEGLQPRGLGTMSPGGRYYAYGVTLSYAPQMFGIELVDLKAGTREIINTDPYICNPHTQFEPSEGKQIMIQHNRGCTFLPDGTITQLVGPEAATAYLVDIPDGKVTRLQLGPPYTLGSTGHESWIGDTKEILVSIRSVVGIDHDVGGYRPEHLPSKAPLSSFCLHNNCSHCAGLIKAGEAYTPEEGNLLGVRAGAPPRVVSKGYCFNHVGTSACGRFFSCDIFPTVDVVMGSIRTGKNAVVCHSESSPEHSAHPHPYLSPDLKWVVFDSDRSGEVQIHVATVSPEMIENLEKD